MHRMAVWLVGSSATRTPRPQCNGIPLLQADSFCHLGFTIIRSIVIRCSGRPIDIHCDKGLRSECCLQCLNHHLRMREVYVDLRKLAIRVTVPMIGQR